MKYRFAEIRIKPLSQFGTPLKGDTIFGEFCWILQWCPQYLNGSFEMWRERYVAGEPFVIFSSAFPSSENIRFFPRPCDYLTYFPLKSSNQAKLRESLQERKKLKNKKWIGIEGLLKIDLSKSRLFDSKEVVEEILKIKGEKTQIFREPKIFKEVETMRNKINRQTGGTGEEGFSPYPVSEIWFFPEIALSIYVLYHEEAFELKDLVSAFSIMGQIGFGKDSSVGMGRFEVIKAQELPLPEFKDYEKFLALSPFVPSEKDPEEIYFEPFTRFGRHGGPLASSSNPFKNPVLMADEGGVIKGRLERPFVGKGLTGLSKVLKETIAQGYALVIPIIQG